MRQISRFPNEKSVLSHEAVCSKNSKKMGKIHIERLRSVSYCCRHPFRNGFTVGEFYWTKPIEKTDAVHVNATFASYQKHYRRHNLSSLTLCFSDYEPLSIDNACFTSDVLNHIENMVPGTILELYVHPNSDTILEMVCGGKVILDFNQAERRLTTKRVSFLILGIFMYTAAAFGVVKLIRKEVY